MRKRSGGGLGGRGGTRKLALWFFDVCLVRGIGVKVLELRGNGCDSTRIEGQDSGEGAIVKFLELLALEIQLCC